MFGRIWRALAVVGALTLLVPSGAARAHDSLPVGEYEVEYGWLIEPPVVGQANALTLTITRSTHSHSSTTTTTHAHSHTGSAGIAIVSPADGEVVETGSVTVVVETTSDAAEAGALHWHLYVDGGLVAMPSLEENSYTLNGLADGTREISVVLSDSDHRDIGTPAVVNIEVTGGAVHSHGTSETSDVDISRLRVEVIYGGQTKLLALEPRGQPGQYQARLTPTRAGVYTLRLAGHIGDTPINADVQPEEVTTTDLTIFPEALPSVAELRQRVEAAEARAQTTQLIAIGAVILGLTGVGSGAFAMLRHRS
jgi:hypothetical protein